MHDPQSDLKSILDKYGLDEFHARSKMENQEGAQNLRRDMLEYMNSACQWGVFVLPNTARSHMKDEFYSLIDGVTKVTGQDLLQIHVDEGIISARDAAEIAGRLKVTGIEICKSHLIRGVQLADMVAALCGVRLREEISATPKMLTYGDEYGFNPPIKAELGHELWAALRYSMIRCPTPKGNEMPDMVTFETEGHGFFVSPHCPRELRTIAQKLFGEVYLGCIH